MPVGTDGSISFAQFMHLALYSPGLGYYDVGTTKFGAAGDFVTAPEISPLFGRVLARQCKAVLDQLGEARILELGAGSGKLAVDLLRSLDDMNALPARYLILETSADQSRKSPAKGFTRDPPKRRGMAVLEATDAGSRGVGWEIAAEGGDTATPLNLGKRMELLEALLPGLSGLRLLDAGCGGGEYVRALVARGADALGIECTEDKLECARSLPASLARRISCGDIQRTEFDSGRFDAVLLNEVLEHVPDDAAALREMHRVLRPEGSLIVFSPNRLHPFETHGVFALRSGRRISHATPFQRRR